LRHQVLGLYGRRGIAPMEERLSKLESQFGRRGRRLFPSVFWLGASDRALVRGCRVGDGASLMLIAGIAPRLSSAALWGTYLSFMSMGQPFLNYQWDALLLETSALAALTAPDGLRPGRRATPPSWAAILAFRWLAFRLHFESGICKLQSKDETWRNLTA